MLEHLTDPRDRVLCAATPTLMAPRFGNLAAPLDGGHRFVAAADGLYIEARSRALELRLRVAAAQVALPYGPLRPGIRFCAGQPPAELFGQATLRARESAPNEWAGLIVLHEGRYALIEPPMGIVARHMVSYRIADIDPDEIVFDLHSHGDAEAYFSEQDDADDGRGGIYLAGVIGRVREPAASSWVLRAVVHGHLLSLPRDFWLLGCGFSGSEFGGE